MGSSEVDALLAAQPAHQNDRDAFKLIEPELASIASQHVRKVNVDVSTVVAVVLGRLPRLNELREAMTKLQPFDMAAFDKVGTYAQAARHAFFHMKTTSPDGEAMAPLVEELTALHELLLSEVRNMAKRNLIDPGHLKKLPGAAGPLNLCSESSALAMIVRDNWSAVQGRTGTQLEELDRVEALSERLFYTLALHRADSAPKDARDIFRRAFTLFANAWDEVRRGVIFLRWHHDDADAYAPSLYRGRGGSGKKENRRSKRSHVEAVPPADAPKQGETV